MSVSRKLWTVVIGLLLSMLALALGAQWQSRRSMDHALAEISRMEQSVATAVRWRGLTEFATALIVTGALSNEPEISSGLDRRVKEVIGRINDLQKDIKTLLASSDEERAFEDVGAERTKVLALLARTRELKQSGDPTVKDFVDTQFSPAITRYLAAQDAFLRTVEQERRDATRALEAERQAIAAFTLGIALLLFGAGVLITASLVRSVVHPLRRATTFADAIASGDLTQELRDGRRDEFGRLLQSLDAMVRRLRSVVGEVRSGVESVSTASAEIAYGNQDLSARTEKAASSLQQTAASMEQLTGTVAQSTDTAHQARQLAGQAAQAATRGGEVMSGVISSMGQISESSRRIGDIIGTIDGIAFQTNILALNAAVEAARAGEQGRGFAVVAGEVRSLAQRSAEAAREIKTLIGTSVATVDVGSRQVGQAGQAMEEIVQGVRRVSDLIAELHAAASEQRDGIGQVNQAVNQLDQMTQQNAALVEESAAAASSLREQAQRLTAAIQVFDVGSAVAAPASGKPAPTERKPVSAGVASRPPAPSLASPVRKQARPDEPQRLRAPPPAPAAAQVSHAGAHKASDPRNDDWESF